MEILYTLCVHVGVVFFWIIIGCVLFFIVSEIMDRNIDKMLGETIDKMKEINDEMKEINDEKLRRH